MFYLAAGRSLPIGTRASQGITGDNIRPATKPVTAPTVSVRDPKVGCAKGYGNVGGYGNAGGYGNTGKPASPFSSLTERWSKNPFTIMDSVVEVTMLAGDGISLVKGIGNLVKGKNALTKGREMLSKALGLAKGKGGTRAATYADDATRVGMKSGSQSIIPNEFPTYRKKTNIGPFSKLKEPMTMEHIKMVSNDAGIGYSGIKINIINDPDMLRYPYTGYTHPGGRMVDLYPKAFTNKENLVKTLGHERIHAMQKSLYGEAIDSNMLAVFENAAYGSESSWWSYYISGGH